MNSLSLRWWLVVAAIALVTVANAQTWTYTGFIRGPLDKVVLTFKPDGKTVDVIYHEGRGDHPFTFTIDRVEGTKVYLVDGNTFGSHLSGWATPTLHHCDYYGQYTGTIDMSGTNQPWPSMLDAIAKEPVVPADNPKHDVPGLAVSYYAAVAGGTTAGADGTATSITGPAQQVLNANGERWTTGRAMQPGDWLMIDLGKQYKIKSVTLDSSQAPNDAAHGVQLLLAQDDKQVFEKVAEKTAQECAPLNGLVKFTLPAGAAAQYVKFIQTGSNGPSWWSVYAVIVEKVPVAKTPPPAGTTTPKTAGDLKDPTNMDSLSADYTGGSDNVNIAGFSAKNIYGVKYSGYINIPKEDYYTFDVTSKGLVAVSIDKTVVLTGGLTTDASESTGDIKLAAGKHAISVYFSHLGGGQGFSLSYYTLDNQKKVAVTADMLTRDPGDLKPITDAVPGAAAVAAMAGWVLTASAGSDTVMNLLNGSGERWTTNAPMKPGDWVQIDMLKDYKVKSVTLDSSQAPGDSAHGLQLYLGDDPKNLTLAGEMSEADCAAAKGLDAFTLAKTTSARYVKFVQTGTNASWWSAIGVNVGIE